MSAASRRIARREDGFTLIEMLVASLCSVIIAGALFAVLEVSLRQTVRITDRVQATQLGRTAMTSVIDELHSACLAREFAPVQAQSTPSELRFVAGFSEKAVIESAEASEHSIVWNGAYPGSGTLIDKTFKASGGTWPNFKFEATATPANGVRLGENVYAQTKEAKEVPLFQYYKYNTKASAGGAESASTTLTLIPLKSNETLGATAKAVAAVQVTFSEAPANNNLALNRSAEFSNLVTLAFAAPSSEATVTAKPCQ
jgi:type II secretory pathway pseudopilin PulG